MTQTHAMIMFLDALEHAPLSEEEKSELREAAEAEGIGQEIWSRLNDRLIASLVRSRSRQSEWRTRLDDEVARYTAAYEKEKAVIDRRMMVDLKAVGSDRERERLWVAYGRDIGALQDKLVAEVRCTSQTVLKEAFQLMVAGV